MRYIQVVLWVLVYNYIYTEGPVRIDFVEGVHEVPHKPSEEEHEPRKPHILDSIDVLSGGHTSEYYESGKKPPIINTVDEEPVITSAEKEDEQIVLSEQSTIDPIDITQINNTQSGVQEVSSAQDIEKSIEEIADVPLNKDSAVPQVQKMVEILKNFSFTRIRPSDRVSDTLKDHIETVMDSIVDVLNNKKNSDERTNIKEQEANSELFFYHTALDMALKSPSSMTFSDILNRMELPKIRNSIKDIYFRRNNINASFHEMRKLSQQLEEQEISIDGTEIEEIENEIIAEVKQKNQENLPVISVSTRSLVTQNLNDLITKVTSLNPEEQEPSSTGSRLLKKITNIFTSQEEAPLLTPLQKRQQDATAALKKKPVSIVVNDLLLSLRKVNTLEPQDRAKIDDQVIPEMQKRIEILQKHLVEMKEARKNDYQGEYELKELLTLKTTLRIISHDTSTNKMSDLIDELEKSGIQKLLENPKAHAQDIDSLAQLKEIVNLKKGQTNSSSTEISQTWKDELSDAANVQEIFDAMDLNDELKLTPAVTRQIVEDKVNSIEDLKLLLQRDSKLMKKILDQDSQEVEKANQIESPDDQEITLKKIIQQKIQTLLTPHDSITLPSGGGQPERTIELQERMNLKTYMTQLYGDKENFTVSSANQAVVIKEYTNFLVKPLADHITMLLRSSDIKSDRYIQVVDQEILVKQSLEELLSNIKKNKEGKNSIEQLASKVDVAKTRTALDNLAKLFPEDPEMKTLTNIVFKLLKNEDVPSKSFEERVDEIVSQNPKTFMTEEQAKDILDNLKTEDDLGVLFSKPYDSKMERFLDQNEAAIRAKVTKLLTLDPSNKDFTIQYAHKFTENVTTEVLKSLDELDFEGSVGKKKFFEIVSTFKKTQDSLITVLGKIGKTLNIRNKEMDFGSFINRLSDDDTITIDDKEINAKEALEKCLDPLKEYFKDTPIIQDTIDKDLEKILGEKTTEDLMFELFNPNASEDEITEDEITSEEATQLIKSIKNSDDLFMLFDRLGDKKMQKFLSDNNDAIQDKIEKVLGQGLDTSNMNVKYTREITWKANKEIVTYLKNLGLKTPEDQAKSFEIMKAFEDAQQKVLAKMQSETQKLSITPGDKLSLFKFVKKIPFQDRKVMWKDMDAVRQLLPNKSEIYKNMRAFVEEELGMKKNEEIVSKSATKKVVPKKEQPVKEQSVVDTQEEDEFV